MGTPLGLVVDGSLGQGVEVRLDPATSVEEVKVGTFVTLQGEKLRFFGVVTDVKLGAASPGLKYNLPDVSNPFIAEVVGGTAVFGTIAVLPSLTMPAVLGDSDSPSPAKTIPPHFARAFLASERDVQAVFGSADDQHFWIGNPLDMETKVCLDLKSLTERSMGIFGKSGTGKTFLTRLLLVGILQSDLASTLIFDMHSEYGWQGRDSERNRQVKGLKQLFGSKVAVFSLDEKSSRQRKLSPDEVVRISYGDIEPEDIEALRENLGLSDVASQAAYNLKQRLGSGKWLEEFLALGGRDDLSELSSSINVQPQALAALHNRLSRFKRYEFMVSKAERDSVQRILEHLDRGMHVVLEFGRYGNDPHAYILVANLLTRRIHERYVQRHEEAEGTGGPGPRPLVIAIEEAHKFLSPGLASQTIFGIIARELRKYSVTLMVIDQRPGGIDQEVMSQVGTKLVCLLDNERDIDAVLGGAPGSRELRTVLARLESKQQALIYGHAVPMPVVVHTREFGSADSYAELSRTPSRLRAADGSSDRSSGDELKDLFG
ncbi:MAG: ATP-binding protein [Dehalococcoidia bacterium]|nr:ATP-binding protein [Dehalococcoidia bacterium]